MIVQSLMPLLPWIAACGQVETETQDSMQALDAQYSEESRQVARRAFDSVDQKREYLKEFYSTWLDRFRDAAKSNSGDLSALRDAQSRIVELLNGLGRYRESLDFEESITKEPSGSGSMLRSTSALYAFFETRDETYARKAIGYAQRAGILAQWGGSRIGQANALMMEASVQSSAFRDHGKAAELYMQAYDQLSQVSDAERGKWAPDYGPEGVLSLAVQTYVQAGKMLRALEVFKMLEGMPEEHRSRENSLGNILHSIEEEGNTEICAYVESWMARHPRSKEIPKFRQGLARRYANAGPEFREKAIAFSEQVLQDQEAGIIELSPPFDLPAYQRLESLYWAAGEKEKAEQIRERISKLPRHGDK